MRLLPLLAPLALAALILASLGWGAPARTVTCASFSDAATSGTVRFASIKAINVGCVRAKQVLRLFAKGGPSELTSYLGYLCVKTPAGTGAAVKCRQTARSSISAIETG
jgi:hypothetical protein